MQTNFDVCVKNHKISKYTENKQDKIKIENRNEPTKTEKELITLVNYTLREKNG